MKRTQTRDGPFGDVRVRMGVGGFGFCLRNLRAFNLRESAFWIWRGFLNEMRDLATLNEPFIYSLRNRFGLGMHFQFVINVLDMGSYSVDADF